MYVPPVACVYAKDVSPAYQYVLNSFIPVSGLSECSACCGHAHLRGKA